jgi:hypothetical protein
MAQASQLIYSVACSRFNVFPGNTLAVFIDVLPGQVYTQIKNVGNTGGLEILQCSSGASLAGGGSQLQGSPNFISGSTLSLSMLTALSGTGYLMAANEVLSLQGPVRCYIAAPSATCAVTVLKGLGAGV